jgi:hypothetical protein
VYQVYSGIYAGSLITSSHGNQVESHIMPLLQALWRGSLLFNQRSPLPYFQVIEWFEGLRVCGVLLLFQIWILSIDPLNDWSSYFWWHKSIQCIKYTLVYVLDPHHLFSWKSSRATSCHYFKRFDVKPSWQSPFTILSDSGLEGSGYVESCYY